MLLFELFVSPPFEYFFLNRLFGFPFVVSTHVYLVCSLVPPPSRLPWFPPSALPHLCLVASLVYKSCVLHPDHQMLSVCGPISLSGSAPPAKTALQSVKFSHLLLLIITFSFPSSSHPHPLLWAPAGGDAQLMVL